MVILQIDDSMIVGTERFLRTEDQMSTLFLSTPSKCFEKYQITTNGVELSLHIDKQIRMIQDKETLKLEMPDHQDAFGSQRALEQYIGVKCWPDICATVQLIAPGSAKVENKHFKLSNKAMDHKMKKAI